MASSPSSIHPDSGCDGQGLIANSSSMVYEDSIGITNPPLSVNLSLANTTMSSIRRPLPTDDSDQRWTGQLKNRPVPPRHRLVISAYAPPSPRHRPAIAPPSPRHRPAPPKSSPQRLFIHIFFNRFRCVLFYFLVSKNIFQI